MRPTGLPASTGRWDPARGRAREVTAAQRRCRAKTRGRACAASNSSALQTVSGRSSSDEPANRVYFGRTRKTAAKKNLLGALSLSRMGKLRQCVTGKARARARARACELQDSSAPMPMSISGGAAGNCRAAGVRRRMMSSAMAARCGGLRRATAAVAERVSLSCYTVLLPRLLCCTRRV